MRVTLKEELKKCKANLRKLLNKRDKWIKEHPGQVRLYNTWDKWGFRILRIGEDFNHLQYMWL